jgi:hypothetical protein
MTDPAGDHSYQMLVEVALWIQTTPVVGWLETLGVAQLKRMKAQVRQKTQAVQL